MTQPLDQVTPFDSSLVDEEALRALRAMQRMLPQGDGGASGALAGGTEAAAGLSIGRGVPTEGYAAGSQPIVSAPDDRRPESDALMKLPDLAPSAPDAAPDSVLSDLLLPEIGAAHSFVRYRPGVAGSSTSLAKSDAAIADAPQTRDVVAPWTDERQISPRFVDPIGEKPSPPLSEPEQPNVTPPTSEEPETSPDEPSTLPEEPLPPSEEQVGEVADAPAVSAMDATGVEDEPIALDLAAALKDVDGSETLSVVISGLASGATLTHGSRNPDGSWTIDPADLHHLALVPSKDVSGILELVLEATARETSSGSVATTQVSFSVVVEAVADAPLVSARDAAGQEDSAIPLNLAAALSDRDGSETLAVTIAGLPAGASLSHGSRQADGSWQVASADLAGLTLTPPANFSGSLGLTVQATTREANGATATHQAGFQVQVAGVADAPSLVVAHAQGQEDKPVRLDGLSGALADTDGSEALSFVLSGVPATASLSAGTRQTDGSYVLTSAQLAGLTLTPPAQFSGQIGLTLTAVATEAGGSRATTAAGFTVSLDPVVDAGTISGSAKGNEDAAIVLKPTFATPDGDGSETWSALTQVAGLPAGASLNRGSEVAPGVWQVATADLRAGLVTLRPAPNSDADFSVTVTATLSDSGNGLSPGRTVSGTIPVTVTAVADAPAVVVHDAAGREDTAIALDLAAVLADTDGSERIAGVTLTGLPEGFALSHGSRAPNGSWSLASESLPELKLTPLRDWHGTLQLTLEATSIETGSGTTVTTTAPFTVTVAAVNDAPELVINASAQTDSGVHETEVIRSVQLQDVDSSQLGGATVTLSGAHPGDRLDLEGFALHEEGGRVMIGHTGIELVGGGYATETGSLILSGDASPETYASVLKALVLESSDESGLAAGARRIGVTLVDSQGTSSTQKVVEVMVEDLGMSDGDGHGVTVPAETAQDVAGADILLLMADDGSDTTNGGAGSWTEQIDLGHAPAGTSSQPDELAHPVPDHVQPIDDFQADLGRVHWP